MHIKMNPAGVAYHRQGCKPLLHRMHIKMNPAGVTLVGLESHPYGVRLQVAALQGLTPLPVVSHPYGVLYQWIHACG